MSDRLFNFIADKQRPLEEALREHLPLSSRRGAERLNEALAYAVFPGGKRLRPVLTLLGAMAAGGCARASMPAACAIEFLHTSSLILDDLPAMDDAEMRRGRPALHLVYGEGVATLAALALLNESYSLLAHAARGSDNEAAVGLLIAEATGCIGSDGMIGGQAADLELPLPCDAPDTLASRSLKTASLMRLTVCAGAVACGASEADSEALAEFGQCLGTAYQIRDDLMDELGDSHLMGKSAGQDARHLRMNFVAEMGVEGAHRMAFSLIEQGKGLLAARFGQRGEALLLADAADFIVSEFGRCRVATDVV